MICYDIGARSGERPELEDIRGHCHLIGFEPDIKECDLLNSSTSLKQKWGNCQYLAIALGAKNEQRTLYITEHAGTSSLLPPNEIAERYNRPQYTNVINTIDVDVTPLDKLIERENLPSPDYLKIDVEGFELEILHGAEEAIANSASIIRAEVSWLPIRRNSPTATQITEYLENRGYSILDYCELHHWRALTRDSPNRTSREIIPRSKGRLIHGDAVFIRNLVVDKDSCLAIVKQAVLLGSMGYLDETYLRLSGPIVRSWLAQHGIVDVDATTASWAKYCLKQRRRKRGIRKLFRSLLRSDLRN